MTAIIYINGKRVTKEEISKTEIKNNTVKQILKDKLTKNK